MSHPQEVLDYGPEGSIPLPTDGQELRFPPHDREATPSYVRIVDAGGAEIVYWSIDEFAEDPGLVLGALLGAMQNGAHS